MDVKYTNRSFKWIEIIIKCDMIEPSNEAKDVKNPQEKTSESFLLMENAALHNIIGGIK